MPINEKIIMSSDDHSLVLTSKRVKHEAKSSSKSQYKSIPIDQVATCALNTRSFPVLLILAVLIGLVIIGLPESQHRILAGVVAVALVVAYFLTRKGQVEIFSTSGESIAVPTKGLSHDQVKQFLEAVESQYHNRCGS